MRNACCAMILVGGTFGQAANEALAQHLGGLVLEATNVVSPQNPQTTIEIWAWFVPIPNQAEFFGRAWFDLHAGDGEFVDVQSPFPYPWGVNWGYNPPVFTGSSILNVDIINSYFYPVPDNPILIGAVQWTTSDFKPRSVDVFTETTEFLTWHNVSPFHIPGVYMFKPGEVREGQAMIQVIPAPTSCLSVGLVFTIWSRRRRS